MKKIKALLAVSALLMIVVSASSCKKSKDAKVIITVLKDSVNFVTQDTVEVAAVQANVRFYSDEIGAEHIDTIIRTSTSGISEFVWPYPAIIKYDISYGNFSSLENYVILEQGETVEKTVNVNHP